MVYCASKFKNLDISAKKSRSHWTWRNSRPHYAKLTNYKKTNWSCTYDKEAYMYHLNMSNTGLTYGKQASSLAKENPILCKKTTQFLDSIIIRQTSTTIHSVLQ